jgi:hypothetical protein
MTFKPRYRVKSNQYLELQRGNPFDFVYAFDGAKQIPFGATGYLTFANTYGQTLDVWEGDASGGVIPFYAESVKADAIPDGASWTLTVDLNDGDEARLMLQGNVVRFEAPYPDAPTNPTPVATGANYNYPFGTPGSMQDPAWRIFSGSPVIYDNSGRSFPNGVAAGGNFSPVGMLYYAPLNTDAVRFTYTLVPGGPGDVHVIVGSNYDATNFATIHHHAGGGDYVAIARGTGPTVTSDQTAHVTHAMAYETFTAEYNPASNTYAVYQGTNTAPLVTWPDTGKTVHHGEGARYVGLILASSGSAAGPQVANWYASDNIGV